MTPALTSSSEHWRNETSDGSSAPESLYCEETPSHLHKATETVSCIRKSSVYTMCSVNYSKLLKLFLTFSQLKNTFVNILLTNKTENDENLLNCSHKGCKISYCFSLQIAWDICLLVIYPEIAFPPHFRNYLTFALSCIGNKAPQAFMYWVARCQELKSELF